MLIHIQCEHVATGLSSAALGAATRGADADEFEKWTIDALGVTLVGAAAWSVARDATETRRRRMLIFDADHAAVTAAAARAAARHAAAWRRVVDAHAPSSPLRLVADSYEINALPAAEGLQCSVCKGAHAALHCVGPHAVCAGVYAALRIFYAFRWYEHVRALQLYEMVRRELAATGRDGEPLCVYNVFSRFIHDILSGGGECTAMHAHYRALMAAVEAHWMQ